MISVGIVDDHAIVRQGLSQFLAEQMGIKVVGEGSSGAQAIELVRAKDPNVLLLDILMPGQNGIEVMRHLLAQKPELAIIVLSGFAEEHYALSIIKNGAKGYLNKGCDPAEIIDAIRTVALGRRYITPQVAELLAQQINRGAEILPHENLSDREMQVFLRLAKGQAVGVIAAELCLSAKSVSTYRTRTLEKMNLLTNSDLTYYAMKTGLMT